jgi:TolA-binding protein
VTMRPARLLAPALVLVLSGCWVPLQRGQQMEARLDALESGTRDNAERLEAQQRRVRETLDKLDKKIAEAQTKLDELNVASRRSGADLSVSVSRLQDDVAKLRGELEVQQHDLAKLDDSIDAYRKKSDKRFAAIQGRGALDEVLAQERVEALPRADERAAFLAAAHKAEQDGDKGVARALFDEYAKRWPNDGNAPDATYRAAEILAAQKRWNDAIVRYGTIYEHAPRSDRAPDAMLGMAQAMLELDDLKKDAPVVLEELVQKYPRSNAATKGKELLAKLTPPASPTAKPTPTHKKTPATPPKK